MVKESSFSSESPWLSASESWDDLASEYNAREFSKGYIFFDQGDYSDYVYLIKRGKVGMCLRTASGAMRVLMVDEANCLFGTYPYFDGLPNCYYAQVLSESASVCVIPGREFVEKLQARPEWTARLLRQCMRGSRLLSSQVEIMSFQGSRERVYFYLIHMAKQNSSKKGGTAGVKLHFTHQGIADMAGLSRVTVSTVLSGLVKEGILRKSNGCYTLLKPEELERRIMCADMPAR